MDAGASSGVAFRQAGQGCLARLFSMSRRVRDPIEVPPLRIGEDPRAVPARVVGAQALGALALGAIAVGALAIGALAIGRLAIGRARIRRIEIDELIVGKLRVTEEQRVPSQSDSESQV